MSQILDIFDGYCYFWSKSFIHNFRRNSLKLLGRKLIQFHGNPKASALKKQQIFSSCRFQSLNLAGNSKLGDQAKLLALRDQVEACDRAEIDTLPNVHSLREFPKEELVRKVVMVRFDSRVLFRESLEQQQFLSGTALSTIKYLYEAGARVILVSSWDEECNSKIIAVKSVAEFLSSILELKVVPVEFVTGLVFSNMEAWEQSDVLLLDNLFHFKGESANCKKFAKQLSSGIDILVNDAFSQSHKILASTVGITTFCYTCIAGFYFEEGLCQLRKISTTSKKPYFAIIGGGNLVDKALALKFLASTCDVLVFVGNMAFQIMHALGLPVPMKLLEGSAAGEALSLVQFIQSRSKSIVLPKDFLCMNNLDPEKLEIISSGSCLDGWQPVDLGPKSLKELASLLPKCKKILWIGPVKFGSSSEINFGASKLAEVLDGLKESNPDIIVVGKMACQALCRKSSVSTYNMIENASVVWEFLKGRKLPGLMALDRAYPYKIHWDLIYDNPTRSLVVDIGSGNGLFLFGMAELRKDLNFLGLEINEKLVNRCLGHVSLSGLKNGYFIRANATSTFRDIVSSYPGKLVLVSIQCPNPDFNKPDFRWRMLQRSLVEAIADLLACGGKVFLQSDVEAVAVRMKDEFIKYGKGKLAVTYESMDALLHQEKWLNGNPFGVQSDWERHVLDRGAPMYRLLLSKSVNCPKYEYGIKAGGWGSFGNLTLDFPAIPVVYYKVECCFSSYNQFVHEVKALKMRDQIKHHYIILHALQIPQLSGWKDPPQSWPMLILSGDLS